MSRRSLTSCTNGALMAVACCLACCLLTAWRFLAGYWPVLVQSIGTLYAPFPCHVVGTGKNMFFLQILSAFRKAIKLDVVLKTMRISPKSCFSSD